jgi:hypothetical protein
MLLKLMTMRLSLGLSSCGKQTSVNVLLEVNGTVSLLDSMCNRGLLRCGNFMIMRTSRTGNMEKAASLYSPIM